MLAFKMSTLKKIVLLSLFFLPVVLSGQAKKPILMLFPDDNWMKVNGFSEIKNIDGKERQVNNYSKAFQSSATLTAVTLKFQSIFLDRGFQVINIADEIKRLEAEAANDMSIESKSGDVAEESTRDVFLKRARPDIILEYGWQEIPSGWASSLQLNLSAKDAYSMKPVAAVTGIGPSADVAIEYKIDEALTAQLNQYCDQMTNYFADIQENGREIEVAIKVTNGNPFDLETEFNCTEYELEDELRFILEEYMARHTVKGRFTSRGGSNNGISFNQVRIPMFNDKGRPTDASIFGNELRKWLKAEPFLADARVVPNGLGSVILLIGK